MSAIELSKRSVELEHINEVVLQSKGAKKRDNINEKISGELARADEKKERDQGILESAREKPK